MVQYLLFRAAGSSELRECAAQYDQTARQPGVGPDVLEELPAGPGCPASSVPRRALQRIQPEYLDVARYGCALRRSGESNQSDVRSGERRRRAASRSALAAVDVLG